MIPIARIAVTKPPDGWFHGITRALFDLYRQALLDLGLTIFDVPVDAFLPPDVVRISSLISDLRAFRPQLAVGLSHGVHALICRLPPQTDGWRPNLFTEVLDIPTLCFWDHAPLEFADQLLAPPHPKNGARETLRRVLAHPRLIHWSRDSGQVRIMKDLGFLLPNRVIHELSPSLPGFLPHNGSATSQSSVGFVGHFHQEPQIYPHPALSALASETTRRWLEASNQPLWDVLLNQISAINPSLHPDRTEFWRFAHQLIVHQAQTSIRLQTLGAADVPVTCYGNLRKDLPGVPQNLKPMPGEIPLGPPLAAVLARHAITIDVLNPGFINGYSHKPVLGFASGGFLLVDRKAHFIEAFGDAGESVSYNSETELRTKLDLFLSNPRLRREVGDVIRDRIQARFQLKDVLQRVLCAASRHIEPADPPKWAQGDQRTTIVVDLLSQLRSEPQWSGASVEHSDAGALVSTAPQAWAYAAAIPVPTLPPTLHQPHLRIELIVQKGIVGLCLLDETAALMSEQLVSPSATPVIVTFELPKQGSATLILRNTIDTASRARVLAASLCDRTG